MVVKVDVGAEGKATQKWYAFDATSYHIDIGREVLIYHVTKRKLYAA